MDVLSKFAGKLKTKKAAAKREIPKKELNGDGHTYLPSKDSRKRAYLNIINAVDLEMLRRKAAAERR